MSRWRRIAPSLGHSLLAGAAGGLAMGAGLRVAMRLAAVTEGQETDFTVGGTLFLLVAGASFGLLLGVLYGSVRRWVPGHRIGRGLVIGVLVAVLLCLLLFADSDSEARLIGSLSVNLLTFGGSFVLWGIVAEWTWVRIEGRPTRGRVGSGGLAGAIIGAGAGVVLAVMILTLWTASGPAGLLSWAGALAGAAFLGLLLGSALGVGYGLIGGAGTGRITYPLVLVGLWLLMVLSVGEEGPTGRDDALQIVGGVSVALAGFASLHVRLARRLLDRLAVPTPPVPPDPPDPPEVSPTRRHPPRLRRR